VAVGRAGGVQWCTPTLRLTLLVYCMPSLAPPQPRQKGRSRAQQQPSEPGAQNSEPAASLKQQGKKQQRPAGPPDTPTAHVGPAVGAWLPPCQQRTDHAGFSGNGNRTAGPSGAPCTPPTPPASSLRRPTPWDGAAGAPPTAGAARPSCSAPSTAAASRCPRRCRCGQHCPAGPAALPHAAADAAAAAG